MTTRKPPTHHAIAAALHGPAAITFDDLAYELRQLDDCLASGTAPDLNAARFISASVLRKLRLTPHAALHAPDS